MTRQEQHPSMTDRSLRQCREALALSQSAFAAQLGVAPESYRPWDAGRLPVLYDTRTTFRHLRARATPADATLFRQTYYNKRVSQEDRLDPLTWARIPSDYPAQILGIRQQLGLSQTRFAALVGAARKAVVYQWETARRCPSPVFWERIQRLSVTSMRSH